MADRVILLMSYYDMNPTPTFDSVTDTTKEINLSMILLKALLIFNYVPKHSVILKHVIT